MAKKYELVIRIHNDEEIIIENLKTTFAKRKIKWSIKRVKPVPGL